MIRLHHVPFTRSFRILWLLTEMGLDFEIVTYAIPDGSLRRPDFLEKSPAGRVPALEIDGLTLFESGAITEYLCETRPEHGFGRPPGDPERPRFLEWIHYAETMAHLIANLNMQWVFLRDPSMRSPTLIKLDTRRLELTLRPLERILGRQDWLLAGGFSGADTMMGYNLLAVPHFVRLDAWPNIRAYVARCAERPAFRVARERDGGATFYDRDFYELTDG